MNNNKMLFVVAYLLMVILGLSACEKNTLDHGPYEFTGIDGNTRTIKPLPDFGEGYTYSDIETDTVNYDSFVINLRPTHKYGSPDNGGSSIGKETFITIDSMVISSTKDYNADYPAGSNLVDLFDVILSDVRSESGVDTDKHQFTLPEFLLLSPYIPSDMFLTLKESPAEAQEFSFDIQYYLDEIDFDYFELSTEGVVIE